MLRAQGSLRPQLVRTGHNAAVLPLQPNHGTNPIAHSYRHSRLNAHFSPAKMDPLSIMASVAGLLAATAKVSKSLSWLTTSLKDAPTLAKSALLEVDATRAALASLQRFLVRLVEGPTTMRRAAFIQLDQLIAILTDAVLTVSDLERLVGSFPIDDDAEASNFTGFLARTKLVWDNEEISAAVGKLQQHKASLSLLLNIVQW